ncbi:MAG: RDD family protein [Thermomicrobiales bacterium]
MNEAQPTRMMIGADVGPSPFAWSEPAPYAWSPGYAGFWRRFFASCIDGILVTIATRIVREVIERIVEANSFDVLVIVMWNAIYLLLLFLIDWLYYAWQESSRHQATIGKRALGIVVTDLHGNRISFGRAIGRHFAHYISFLTLLIGYLIQPFTKRRQALHDLIAGTLVVRR